MDQSKTKRFFVFLLTAVPIVSFLSGCDSKLSVKELSQLVVTSLSCENFETKMFDGLLLALDNDGELPKPEELHLQLTEDFKSIENSEDHKSEITEIIFQFLKIYSDIYKNHPESFSKDSVLEIKKYLMAIETRDQMSMKDINFISKYKSQLNLLQKSAQKLKQDCTSISDTGPEVQNPPPVTSSGTFLDSIKNKYNLEVYGAYKTFATAYQNCDAAERAPLDKNTKSLKGISVVGTHESGTGKIRVISSLRDVQKTHPYLNERQPSSSCFNTFKNPLIYDYGGKPESQNTQSSELNFFKNDGTGSKALGTDCSGFIFSSLASAGFKFAPDVKVKARHVLAYKAARYVNPKSSGLTCFEKVPISKTSNLRPGDIVASTGHIFMITKTATDPLGIDNKTKMKDCDNIDESQFDFEIMQSSPSLGAIGINKMKASDYLAESTTMKKAMVHFAKKLCQVKFTNASSIQTSTRVSIVRHKQTDECKAQSEIQLSNQKCIQACRNTRF